VLGTLCGTSRVSTGHGSEDPNTPTINLADYNMNQMLEAGGGVTYRHQVRGSRTGLWMIDNGWYYFPTRTRCSVLSPWEAKMVNIDVPIGPNKAFAAGADSRVTSTVRDLPCRGEGLE
jgi:hypothetical protein